MVVDGSMIYMPLNGIWRSIIDYISTNQEGMWEQY